MEKQFITEDMHLENQWFDRARTIKTADELKEFAEELFGKYNHDYGTTCHAITALALAAAHLGAETEGITGFQAGLIMWGFVKQWNHTDNKLGMRLWDFDKILYPQYEHDFEKTIDHERWEMAQAEAQKLLDSGRGVECVREHWQSIVDGKLPFGFVLSDK